MKKIVTIIACTATLGIALAALFMHFLPQEATVVSESVNKIKPSKQIVIGYSAPDFCGGQQVIMQGLITRATKKGWEVINTNANYDAKVQESQIEYLIAQGVDVIVAVPVDSKAIASSIKKAKADNIPFYTIDRAPIGSKIEMSVLADNHMAGVQSGQAMVELLTKRYGTPKGIILELQGNLCKNVVILRGAGFHSVVDKYTDIKVISRKTEGKSKNFGFHTQEITSKENIDGIYLHSDSVGMSTVLSVLAKQSKLYTRDNPKHIFLTGIDGNNTAIQGIRDGYVDQASSQPLTDFGILVDWIEKRLNGQKIHKETITDKNVLWSPAFVKETDIGWQLLLSTTSVTKDNVDDKLLWGNQVQK